MTEERRKMIEILKEVDDFFQQCGVYEAVEAFIHSEEVTNRVEEASAQLITNLQIRSCQFCRRHFIYV